MFRIDKHISICSCFRVDRFFTVSVTEPGSDPATPPQQFYFLEDLIANVDLILRHSPHMVIVDVMTNEFANMDWRLALGPENIWKETVDKYIQRCLDFAALFKDGLIILFLEVQPRTKFGPGNNNCQEFERYAQYYNSTMKELARIAKGKPGIMKTGRTLPSGLCYGKLQGWRTFNQQGHPPQARQPDSMLCDGIHPSPHTINQVYKKCLRRVILDIENRPPGFTAY